MKGQVKTIVRSRGFGFITAENREEVFFHRSALDGDFDSLEEGAQVEFNLERGPKGLRAASVKIVPA